MKQPLISVNDIPTQGSQVIDFFGRQAHVFLKNGVPRAVMNTCTHLGGPLDYCDGKFVCQWHQAEFAPDGERLEGPAPSRSRLMFLPTRVEDGVLTYVWGE